MDNFVNLENTAKLIRQDIIKMLYRAQSGHSAGSLGMADVFTALYFNLLSHNPKKPKWSQRDRLILSNGHICPLLYACLARSGYFPYSLLDSLRQVGSKLQGHPVFVSLPGVENTAGPIGQGVSMAVGIALAAKMNHKNFYTVCITSDGEQQEGEVWEAYMLASKYKLNNLIFILDNNNIQIDGYIPQVLPIEPLKAKYEAFGLCVFELDGHNLENIIDTFLKAKTINNQAVMLIAHTIAGKGVSFMENQVSWHGKAPNKQEMQEALKELMY